MSATLILFPAAHLTRIARERLNRPEEWINAPVLSEPLGAMLHRLALRRPAVLFVLADIVADMLTRLGKNGGSR